MTGKLLPLLSLAAAVMACVIIVELASNASAPPMTLRDPAALGPGTPAQPSDSATAQRAILLARPLFSPDRKPDATQGSDDPRLPHLTGILVTSQERKAIFAGRDGSRGSVVSPGDQVGTYRVQAIEVAQVTLLGADGLHVVHPTFAAAAPPGPVSSLAMPPLQLPTLPTVPGALTAPGSGSPR